MLGTKQQALGGERQATGADQSAPYAGRQAPKDAETKCLRVQMPRPMTNAVKSCLMKVINMDVLYYILYIIEHTNEYVIFYIL